MIFGDFGRKTLFFAKMAVSSRRKTKKDKKNYGRTYLVRGRGPAETAHHHSFSQSRRRGSSRCVTEFHRRRRHPDLPLRQQRVVPQPWFRPEAPYPAAELTHRYGEARGRMETPSAYARSGRGTHLRIGQQRCRCQCGEPVTSIPPIVPAPTDVQHHLSGIVRRRGIGQGRHRECIAHVAPHHGSHCRRTH